jgi:hypothetical protein
MPGSKKRYCADDVGSPDTQAQSDHSAASPPPPSPPIPSPSFPHDNLQQQQRAQPTTARPSQHAAERCPDDLSATAPSACAGPFAHNNYAAPSYRAISAPTGPAAFPSLHSPPPSLDFRRQQPFPQAALPPLPPAILHLLSAMQPPRAPQQPTLQHAASAGATDLRHLLAAAAAQRAAASAGWPPPHAAPAAADGASLYARPAAAAAGYWADLAAACAPPPPPPPAAAWAAPAVAPPFFMPIRR